MKLSRYVKIYPSADQPGRSLLYSTRHSSAIMVPDELLRALLEGALTGAHRDTLGRLGFLVPDPDAERRQMRDIFIDANRRRRQFTAVVVLNLDCNLACSYCYEGNFRGSFYMSPRTADLFVDTVIREQIGKGNEIHISFYGGEPLLSVDLIKEISARLGCAARANGTRFSFSLVTNGTLLTRELVQELIPLGLMGAKVTLDGPRDTHDVSRPFLSGNGSFDAIAGNLAEVCDLIAINLGGNFTRDNYRFFPALLDELVARGIAPGSLDKVIFGPVVPKSGEKAGNHFGSDCVCSYDPWVIEASVYLREETLKRGFPTPGIKMSACSVEYESNIVVNYNGDLYKCPAFMSDDALKIGTLEDGIRDHRESHNMDVWKKDECLDCPYLPICFGGCRQMTLLRTEAIEDVDCRKEYYDAALETMVRQDLAVMAKKKA